jgi:hypothetical protein
MSCKESAHERAAQPGSGRGEVRVRVLASGLEYTDVVIRRHLYPQTMRRRPPFVLGYDVVGEIDPRAPSTDIGWIAASLRSTGWFTASLSKGGIAFVVDGPFREFPESPG